MLNPSTLRKWSAALIALTLLVAPAAPAWAADGKPAKAAPATSKAEAKKPEKARSPIRGEYAIMVKHLGIAGDQLETFTAKVQARSDAIDKWEQAHAEQIATLKQQFVAARESNNEQAMKDARAAMRELGKQRRAIIDTHRAAILATLNTDQRLKYHGFNLYRGMMVRYKRVGLSEQQDATIRTMCEAAAVELGEKYSDDKARRDASRALAAKVHDTVLTAEQQASLKEPDKAASKPEAKAPAKPKSE